MKSIIFMITTMLSVGIYTHANADTKYEIEVDPATFALNGYSMHFRFFPDGHPKLRLGAGLYSLEFPDAIIDINDTNKNEGWNVNLDQGVGLFAEYFINSTHKGWFAGIQLAQQNFLISNDASGTQEQKFTNMLVMPYGGYRWSLDKNLYTQAWFGLGYTETVSGSTQLGSEEYDVDPTIPYGALHIGYSF